MPTLRNVTDVLLRYLDAKQHVWNSYFWGKVTNLKACEPLDSFEAIDRHLFFALVCFPLSVKLPENWVFRESPLRRLVVKPKSYLTEIELMVGKPSSNRNSYWEKRATFPAEVHALSFIEFFQWERYGFWSCSLVRCRIHSAAINEHLGRDALVDLANVNFFLDRSSAETA